MPILDFDTLSLIASQGSTTDLRSLASVCHAWRSAAVPYLFHNLRIDLRAEQEGQLRNLESSIFDPDWPCQQFVRELRVGGDDDNLLNLYVHLLAKSLPSFENLSHFTWEFQDNIPQHLFNVLNHRATLQCLTIRVFPSEKQNNFDYLAKSSKILELVIDAKYFNSQPLRAWSSKMPSIWGKNFRRNFQADTSSRRKAIPIVRQAGHTNQLHDVVPRLESLTLDGYSVRQWQMQGFPDFFDLEGLKRLSLVYCDNPMLLKWQHYPTDLEVLQIIDPFPTYPIKAGLLIRENTLARPLSHFRRLTELSLHNVGAPICEVLYHLRDSGNNLKVLRLHDQEISGIDRWDCFRRSQPQPGDSERLVLSFVKLLIHICPNVEILSLDVRHYGLKNDSHSHDRWLGSDAFSASLEPLMEELALISGLSLSQNFHRLAFLRHLRIVTPHITDYIRKSDEWEAGTVMEVAERMWSSSLETFTLVTCWRPQSYNDLLATQSQADEIERPLETSEWCVKSREGRDAFPTSHKELYFVDS